MNRLRTRLIAVFLAATLAPLAITLWLTASLLEHSLSYASTTELDELSRSLEQTGREFYQRAREALKNEAASGRLAPQRYPATDVDHWPAQVRLFWESNEPERFLLSGEDGERLNYLARRPGEVAVYSRRLGGVGLQRLSRQYARAREVVERAQVKDLRRGLNYTLFSLAGAVWALSLGALIYMAHRVSRPIQDLTAGLGRLAQGDLNARLAVRGDDEIGRAQQAFNRLGEQLEESRKRLAYLSRLAGWQDLARKMAHELKNSLTPIRLTMEELIARPAGDRAFQEQAAQIVIDEVGTLERRVRAFSEFATEPPIRPATLDLNALVEDRVAFLRAAHPEVLYQLRLSGSLPPALADEDVLKGILTNLLENAAQAAGAGGIVLALTGTGEGRLRFEVHDSGPGLSPPARQTLFEPSISFKKGGMGLGLSIARKGALLLGGDITLIPGELGGAAFRVTLPLGRSA